LEGRVVNAADKVVFTSDEMRLLVCGKYDPKILAKSGVLPHAFVPQWYEMGRSLLPHETESAAVRMLHTGHFYGPRSPRPLIDALKRMNERGLLGQDLEIFHYGGMDEDSKRRIAEGGLQDIFHTSATVGYFDTLATMGEADYLLLIDAKLTTTAESVFLPSKLVDYLGSGTPVIGITPRNGTSSRIIEETGGLVCDIERPDQIERVLESVMRREETRPVLRRDAIQQYNHEKVGKRMSMWMKELVS
jgi:hypothetical protein